MRVEDELDRVSIELREVKDQCERSRKVWSEQEDRMLNQITRADTRTEILIQQKSQLMEVIESLGEILGQNKSELQGLKLFRQRENNFYIESTPKSTTKN